MGESEVRYASIPIGKVLPDKDLPTDIYLNIAGKFIKFRHSGDSLGGEKYNFLISKCLKEFFIPHDKMEDFLVWVDQTRKADKEEMVRKAGGTQEAIKLVDKVEDLHEKVYDTFSDLDLDEGTVELLKESVNEFITIAQENSKSKMALARLLKLNSSIADHSLNVANLSVFFGIALGNGNHLVLENLYMGALFHDYGKTRISPDILKKPESAQYAAAIRGHPAKGVGILEKMPNISNQAKTIVLQHHEAFGGNGYPAGIKGEKIYGLARIVSIANTFENCLVENRKMAEKERTKKAIKMLQYDKGKQFDPEMVERIIQALKISYSVN